MPNPPTHPNTGLQVGTRYYHTSFMASNTTTTFSLISKITSSPFSRLDDILLGRASRVSTNNHKEKRRQLTSVKRIKMPDLPGDLNNNHLEHSGADEAVDHDTSYDDLQEIDFPIVEPNSYENNEDRTSPHEINVVHTESTTIIDENAVLRCFDLSITAHMKGVGDVPEFQSMSTEELIKSRSCRDGDDFNDSKDSAFIKENHTTTICEGRHSGQNAGNNLMQAAEKGSAVMQHEIDQRVKEEMQEPREWSPGSLPLPPWAFPS